MDKSLLKKTALQSVVLMLAVITLSYAMKQYQTVTISASNLTTESISVINNAITQDTKEAIDNSNIQELSSDETDLQQAGTISELDDLRNIVDETLLNQLSDNYLVIKKPEGDNLTLSLLDLYINKSIQITLTGIKEEGINSDLVYRVRGEEIFIGSPVFTEETNIVIDEDEGTSEEVVTKNYGNDLSHGITIIEQKDTDTKKDSVQMLIELDDVYAYITYEDDNFYFIDLRKPSEVYDKVLVIDAGHGGKDGGALSKGKKFFEKDINLDIALHLKELLDKEESIKVYYTRTNDDTVFLRPRVVLANAVNCDYFISIHCNANEITSPNGTEVLYYDNEFKGVAAVDLAHLFSDELAKAVSLKQRGVIEKHMDDIFIMDKSVVPTILIEVGYLSNNNDMNFLSKSDNRRSVAQGIYNAIIKAYSELPASKEVQ